MRSLLDDFRIKLADLFNQTDLPLDVKFYVLKDVYNEVNQLMQQFLQMPEPKTQDNNIEQKVELKPQEEEIPITVYKADGTKQESKAKIKLDKDQAD